MILGDLWPIFQGHDNIQLPITRLIVSRVWPTQWFHFQWPWVTVNLDLKVTGLSQMPSTYCGRSWHAICLQQLSSCFPGHGAYNFWPNQYLVMTCNDTRSEQSWTEGLLKVIYAKQVLVHQRHCRDIGSNRCSTCSNKKIIIFDKYLAASQKQYKLEA